MIVTKCTEEGLGSCKQCSDNGKFNMYWMTMLYKIESLDGCYCGNCVRDITKNYLNQKFGVASQLAKKGESNET